VIAWREQLDTFPAEMERMRAALYHATHNPRLAPDCPHCGRTPERGRCIAGCGRA